VMKNSIRLEPFGSKELWSAHLVDEWMRCVKFSSKNRGSFVVLGQKKERLDFSRTFGLQDS
jgi:hypothetical protein